MTERQENKIFKTINKAMNQDKGFLPEYVMTRFTRATNSELYNICLNEETLYRLPKSEIKEIFTEINRRIVSKVVDFEVPMSKIVVAKRGLFGWDKAYGSQSYDKGIKIVVNSPSRLERLESKYESYCNNVLYTLFHETRHSYQHALFIRDSKGEFIDSYYRFMKAERLMRMALIMNDVKWKDNYDLDTLELDANSFTLEKFRYALEKGEIQGNRKLIEKLLEEIEERLLMEDDYPDRVQAQLDNFNHIKEEFKKTFKSQEAKLFIKNFELDSEYALDEYKDQLTFLYKQDLVNAKAILKQYHKLITNGAYDRKIFEEDLKHKSFAEIKNRISKTLDVQAFADDWLDQEDRRREEELSRSRNQALEELYPTMDEYDRMELEEMRRRERDGFGPRRFGGDDDKFFL